VGKRFLIVHLVSNGDCLMMTAVARQIKQDNPGCHLTWAIGYKCKQVIENNPDIDHIWKVHYSEDENPYNEVWKRTRVEAEKKRQAGEFDEIIYSQIYPDNSLNFDGTTRSSTFRSIKFPVRDVTPIIRLHEFEIKRVEDFAKKYELKKYKHVVLCECAPGSGQSFMTATLMKELTELIAKEMDDAVFIISSHLKIESNNKRIIDGSQLSFRENAELSKYCNLLIGCSSGISWLLTSNWAKKINTVQFLASDDRPFAFASIAYDFKNWGLTTDHIIESDNNYKMEMKQIIISALSDFSLAKRNFDQEFKPSSKAIETFIYNINLPISLRSLALLIRCADNFFKRNSIKTNRVFLFFFVCKIKGMRALKFLHRKILFKKS